MEVTINWLTQPQEAKDRAMWTIGKKSKPITKEQWRSYLLSEHSILHSVILSIKVKELDQFTSVHFVRHKHSDHYVRSNRPDWTGKARSLDDTKDHWIDANVQGLIDMARKRLCTRASTDAHNLMLAIKNELAKGDEYMQMVADVLQPNCIYRGGRCFEGSKSCGRFLVYE